LNIRKELISLAISAKSIKKGDYVVHAAHGVGKVIDIEEKELGGKTRKYYKVKTNSLTYWVPVKIKRKDKIRKVSSPYTFRNMLSLIRRKPKTIAKQYRSRKKKVSTALTKISLKAKTRMIRDLYGRQVRKDLNFNDRMALEKLKKNFVDEWVVASGLKKDEAMEKLEKALGTSAAKIIKES
jgi:RNA polymerase-interacting CarD/CdnL/TRCF family regulator